MSDAHDVPEATEGTRVKDPRQMALLTKFMELVSLTLKTEVASVEETISAVLKSMSAARIEAVAAILDGPARSNFFLLYHAYSDREKAIEDGSFVGSSKVVGRDELHHLVAFLGHKKIPALLDVLDSWQTAAFIDSWRRIDRLYELSGVEAQLTAIFETGEPDGHERDYSNVILHGLRSMIRSYMVAASFDLDDAVSPREWASR